MSYQHIQDNKWYECIHLKHKSKCCDCGLVHDVEYKITKGKIQFKFRRNKKATKLERERKGQYQ